MCLGVPGRVVAIDGPVATVDFWGVRREVRLDVVDEPVAIGDYVLNHVGYAIRRIPEREIGETLALYELLLREAEREDGGPSGPWEDGGPSGPWPEDAMAADVRGEIAAAAPSRGSRRGG